MSASGFCMDYHYEEQKISLYDVKDKLISESFNYRMISTDNTLKRISVESTEVAPDLTYKNKNLYRIYQGPRKKWFLEDTHDQRLKMEMTIRNPTTDEWPIKAYTATGPTPEGGKQKIFFEQNMANSKGRIDYFDWKGNPKGHLIIDGKIIHEAQYLEKLRNVKH